MENEKKIIAITSCPTGIAHTFMAAEALEKSAKLLGYEIKVETQGSVGAKNVLTEADVQDAYAVIIAADTNVDMSRFTGKRVYETTTKDALHNAETIIKSAMRLEKPDNSKLMDVVSNLKKERSAQRVGFYKHLMTGVSFMLPLVVAGGLIIALSFVFGIEAFKVEGSLAAALMEIGGNSAFKLMIPVLAAYIAFSIADRPGITPGIIGGMLAANIGAGFLGGIVAGFFAGYFTDFLNKKIQLPKNLQGLKPILILPFISTLVVGLSMIYLIGTPVKFVLDSLTIWLNGMQQTSALMLGLVLGAMMAFDMGGPVNKAAYTFAVGLLASNVTAPMAAVMAAGMTPPLGLALSTVLFKHKFTSEEHEASKAAFVLGLSFITEGAIPYAARDPFRVIPAIMIGSAITGSLSMLFGCQLLAPHGGLFVLAIPNAVTNLFLYLIAISVGTVATALILLLVKKTIDSH